MGGGGSTYDYGFRIYNPTIAKFLSVDPLTKEYPWYTPYQFAGNTPIQAVDLDGLEELYYKDAFRNSEIGETVINIANITTLYKEFNMNLKSQNNFDAYIVTFDSKVDWFDGSFANIKIKSNGHPSGNGIAKGAIEVARNASEFKKLRSSKYAFATATKDIDYDKLNTTFKSGKGMIFIMVAEPLMNPSSNTGSGTKDINIFIKNAIRNATNTTVHEAWNHALNYLKDKNHVNSLENTLKDHKNFHGKSTISSPSVEEYDSNPENYKGTSFEKNIKEIDAELEKK